MSEPKSPIINAPPIVTALALILIGAHGLMVLVNDRLANDIMFHGALIPERFWGWAGLAGSPAYYPPYDNAMTALSTLVTTGLLHADWMHVLLNAIMLVAVGKPVHDALTQMALPDQRFSPSVRFVLFFLFSIIGGSIAHLVSFFPDGVVAIGASGGVCGLIGAVLLLTQSQDGRLLSAGFLKASAAFFVVNLIYAYAGPYLFGMEIAWQAHIGGYVAGALAMRYLIARRRAYSL